MHRQLSDLMSLPNSFKILYGSASPNGQPRIEEIPLQKPSANQVLIKMEFAPINPSDIGVMQGVRKYTDVVPHPVGLEGSGTIVAVGDGLKVQHKVGDRVHVAGYGTMGQYLLTESENVSKILQADLSFEEAASHYINPGTVYYMGVLVEEGGHKAAIHTVGASALGKMLIRYFKKKGIKLINIVRKEEQIEELLKEGADYVLNSQAPDFEAKLKELAEKEGATIAFDAICGEFTTKVIKSQPRGSIVYVYGGLAGFEVVGLSIFDLLDEKSVSGLILFDYLDEVKRKGGLEKFYDEIHKDIGTVFKTSINKVFTLDQINEAVAFYQANPAQGKVLIKPN